MKKLLFNAGIVLFHLLGLIVIVGWSLSKLIWHNDWGIEEDIFMLLGCILCLAIHYSLLIFCKIKISKTTSIILAGMDFIVVIFVFTLLLIPSEFICIRHASQIILILFIHFLVAMARIVFWRISRFRV